MQHSCISASPLSLEHDDGRISSSEHCQSFLAFAHHHTHSKNAVGPPSMSLKCCLQIIASI